MASVLNVTSPMGSLATFLDCDPTNPANTGPFLYLAGTIPNTGTPVLVQIAIHPHSPVTSVFNPAVVLNGTTPITVTQMTLPTGALILTFNLPNGTGEVAGRWNSLDVTAQDSSGHLAFNTFYYYKEPPPVIPTTLGPPTTIHPMPMSGHQPKSRKKGKN